MPKDILGRIKQRLQQGNLPGQQAQLTMAHALRGALPGPGDSYRRAAVMALFYPAEDQVLKLIYIVRTSHDPRDRHAGQIAFPGGSVDPTDVDLTATALREVEEEIGVQAEQVSVLGELTDLYIPVSNFLVTPFIGYTPKRPDYTLQESEVARLLELPFEDFLATEARQQTTIKLSNGMELKHVPCWVVQDNTIWGATSMITAEIVALAQP